MTFISIKYLQIFTMAHIIRSYYTISYAYKYNKLGWVLIYSIFTMAITHSLMC